MAKKTAPVSSSVATSDVSRVLDPATLGLAYASGKRPFSLAVPLKDLHTLKVVVRERDEKHVDNLAAMFASDGQEEPARAYLSRDGQVVLLTGEHRKAAAEKLSWTTLDVVFEKDPGDDASRYQRGMALNAHKGNDAQLPRQIHVYLRLLESEGRKETQESIAAKLGCSQEWVSHVSTARTKAIPELREKFEQNEFKFKVYERLSALERKEQRSRVLNGNYDVPKAAKPKPLVAKDFHGCLNHFRVLMSPDVAAHLTVFLTSDAQEKRDSAAAWLTAEADKVYEHHDAEAAKLAAQAGGQA